MTLKVNLLLRRPCYAYCDQKPDAVFLRLPSLITKFEEVSLILGSNSGGVVLDFAMLYLGNGASGALTHNVNIVVQAVVWHVLKVSTLVSFCIVFSVYISCGMLGGFIIKAFYYYFYYYSCCYYYNRTCQTTCVPVTDADILWHLRSANYLQYLAASSTLLDIRPFPLSALQSGTLFQIPIRTRLSVQTVSDVYLKRNYLLDTSAFSALKVLDDNHVI